MKLSAIKFSKIAGISIEEVPEDLLHTLNEFAEGTWAQCRACAGEMSIHDGADFYFVRGRIVLYYCIPCFEGKDASQDWNQCGNCEEVHTEFVMKNGRCKVCGCVDSL